MDAPYYNGEPGAMPYDHPEWTERHESQPKLPTCRDCGVPISEGEHSTGNGLIYCSPCWYFRQSKGWQFDPRTKIALIADASRRTEVA